ncbi:hypothetical protein [Burkholderia plantarii]|uniref:hypothetical protein n=1 Tax=Burkholderia plantarii TaxID=41899 RepID=UPI0018DE35E4|nr:hypothetical protein [Burkholderia plantarii]MBI0330725.1 hypothetical protein [Burkholderia plantarii]
MSSIRSRSLPPSTGTRSSSDAPGTADGAGAAERGRPTARQSDLPGVPPSRTQKRAASEGPNEAARSAPTSRAASSTPAGTAAPALSTDPGQQEAVTTDAKSVTTLAGLRASLGKVGGLDESLRARPLGVLADRIEQLPEADRTAAFSEVFAATVKLPLAAQSRPLANLAFHASDLPESAAPHEPAASPGATASGEAAPSPRAQAYARTAAAMAHVEQGGQATPHERSDMLMGLSNSAWCLPHDQHPQEISRLLNRIDELPTGLRGAAASVLIYQLGATHADMKPIVFARAAQHIEAPDADDKLVAQILPALAAGVHQLPGERQRSTLEALVPRIAAIKDVAARDSALFNAVLQIQHLPLTSIDDMASPERALREVVGTPGPDASESLRMADAFLTQIHAMVEQLRAQMAPSAA